jgi:hypothetical protein
VIQLKKPGKFVRLFLCIVFLPCSINNLPSAGGATATRASAAESAKSTATTTAKSSTTKTTATPSTATTAAIQQGA